jgi:hypothetical protein
MDKSGQDINALKDIRNMMERSSRFISLSGWSGIAAGMFALAGAWVANDRLHTIYQNESGDQCAACIRTDFMIIATIVFVLAFVSAILFTIARSKKDGGPVWSVAARRLIWNTLLPMIVGGVFIIELIHLNYNTLLVPASLIFYGLALVNGSKYTMGEVRYLGYAQIITGLVSLYVEGNEIYMWALGFGVLHIAYGIIMWVKYER